MFSYFNEVTFRKDIALYPLINQSQVILDEIN